MTDKIPRYFFVRVLNRAELHSEQSVSNANRTRVCELFLYFYWFSFCRRALSYGRGFRFIRVLWASESVKCVAYSRCCCCYCCSKAQTFVLEIRLICPTLLFSRFFLAIQLIRHPWVGFLGHETDLLYPPFLEPSSLILTIVKHSSKSFVEFKERDSANSVEVIVYSLPHV